MRDSSYERERRRDHQQTPGSLATLELGNGRDALASKELIVINPTDHKPSLEYIKHDIPSNKKEIKYINKEDLDLLVDELKLKNL